MKTILKSISLLALVAGLASCNNVAKFEDGASDGISAFVSFSGKSYSVKENAGSVKIPVNIVTMSNKEFTTAITYSITGGDAVEGVDYTMPNKTGVITISTNPEKCDSIEVCPIDMSGTLTKNTTIEFTLGEAVDNGVEVGGTTKCKLTIIDIDGGINLMVGNWAGGDGTVSFDFNLELVADDDEALADFPDANMRIATGMQFKDKSGNSWDSQIPVYCQFNDDKNELWIFPEQVFDAGNFGDPYGVLYIAIDVKATIQGTPTNVEWAINGDVMTLKEEAGGFLYTEEGKCNGLWVGAIPAGLELRKQ